jgi:hypothetical protein
MLTTLTVDIETGPLPEPELLAMLPPFDPKEVKCGNLKDPAKIAEKIAEAEANHLRDFTERAALDPLTGRILAIGVLGFDPRGELGPDWTAPIKGEIFGAEDEAAMLREFWGMVVSDDHGRLNHIVGFNLCLFDLPFLFRRSWKHGITPPAGLRRGRYWGDNVVDLRDLWQLGDRQARGSLDAIARHLGVGAKTGNGAEFAALWKRDQDAAIEYLKNDLQLTAAIAGRLGVYI